MYNGDSGKSAASSVENGGGGAKKRRHNVGKACENCRRRRVKCDGVQPHCGTCKVYNDECSWDPKGDLRKPLSRQQVDALRTRVDLLERMLRDNGLDPGLVKSDQEPPNNASAPGPSRRRDETVFEDDSSPLANPNGDLRDWSQNHLVEHDTGDFQVYGPTSAFRHLRSNSIGEDRKPYSPTDQPSPMQNDFRRFLPESVDISEEQHEMALDRFFRYYASWAQRSHPLLFHEDMYLALSSPGPIKTAHYSPMLHNAILSIALCFVDEPDLRQPAIRKVFVAEAKKYIDSEAMNPTVATVQALAHLASYYSLAAEHNLGWLYIGMALRCAMALGLNMDCAPMLRNGKLTEGQARERNVTYWTTFIQEGLWAPYIGRPVNLPEHTTLLPTVDHQLDSLLWTPHDVPGRYIDNPLRTQPGMISSTFVETVKLMEIGARIMNTLYGIKADMATLTRSGVISEISLALSTWLEQLPPALVINSHAKNALPHILMMHMSWAWLVILLHRPFYRPRAGMPGNSTKGQDTASYNAALAVKHCDRAAVQIITHLQTWQRLHDLRFTPPTAMQCCFVAGTTHLLSFASSRTDKKKADALSRAQECVRLMGHMAVSWPAAVQSQRLLENLLKEYGMEDPNSGINSTQQVTSQDPLPMSGLSLVDQVTAPVPQGAQPQPALPAFMARSTNFSPPIMSGSYDPMPMQQQQIHPSQVQHQHPPQHQRHPLAHPQYPPVDNYGLPFGNFDFGLPQADTDWDPNNFVVQDVVSDQYTQALFDHIMLPHLEQSQAGYPPPRR